jgi:hypothetical protein
MIPRSPLDDPATATFAWARYRRLMRGMAAATLVTVVSALLLMVVQDRSYSVHFYIATALGIAFAMLLMAALMGLVFLSHGTGHDEAICDPLADDPEVNGPDRSDRQDRA